MAEGSDNLQIDQDIVRGIRCSVVVGHILTGIMQEVMEHSPISPLKLNDMINNDRHFRHKKITPDEMNVIQTLTTNGYRKLDINLMYKLMKYFKGIIPAPTRGWKHYPQPSDLAIGDDMRRIKDARNFFGHNICPSLSQDKMEELFRTYSDVGERADSYLKKDAASSYKQLVLKHKNSPIDKSKEDEILDKERQLRRNMELSISFTDNRACKLDIADDTRNEWKRKFESNPSGSTNLKFVFEGIENPKVTSEKINAKKDEINQMSEYIKIVDVSTGSIVLYVCVKNQLINNNQRLIHEVEQFIQVMLDLAGFRFKNGRNNYFMITHDEDAVEIETSSDDEDDNCSDLYPEQKKNLIVRVDVNNKVFETEERLRHNVNKFCGTLMNGQTIIKQTEIAHPTERGKGACLSNDEYKELYRPELGKRKRRDSVDTGEVEKINVNMGKEGSKFIHPFIQGMDNGCCI